MFHVAMWSFSLSLCSVDCFAEYVIATLLVSQSSVYNYRVCNFRQTLRAFVCNAVDCGSVVYFTRSLNTRGGGRPDRRGRGRWDGTSSFTFDKGISSLSRLCNTAVFKVH